MARGRKPGSRNQGQVPMLLQPEHTVFALDIGTRSVIGMVGVVEDDKVKIIAIEKEEHGERAMIDGQIENIEKVASLAEKVKNRLESKTHVKLNRVCVAAAGRALRTQRADFQLDLPGTQLIDDEVISRLEAGAISKAEDAFEAENRTEEGTSRRFYLVGYTVCQYYLDQYMISSLKDHRGQQVKVDLIATFLPSEVVESLYTTMNKIGLEVASITLEPIAAINAAIPGNLRLLNLVMVDIGAGTSDIAACTDGSVTGYTMATVAGDEITENIMKEYLVDFKTAEQIKMQIDSGTDVTFTDILGFEQHVPCEEIIQCIQGSADTLCREISAKILEVNGGAPSALFLAGGGSKLSGLKDKLTEALKMDAKRVAIAGRNFQANAFSDEYDLDNPEYATPLGIVISSGLNLIHDSFRVILNGRPAKLFRSGSFTALNLLMMNGYNFQDLMGRSGQNLVVSVNGKRKVFYGTASQPASLFINKKEGKLSEIIHAGDSIDFVPAVYGAPASACLGDIEGAEDCQEITLNGMYVPLETPLKNGDIILITFPEPEEDDKKEESRDENHSPDTSETVKGEETDETLKVNDRNSNSDSDNIPNANSNPPSHNHQITFDELLTQNRQSVPASQSDGSNLPALESTPGDDNLPIVKQQPETDVLAAAMRQPESGGLAAVMQQSEFGNLPVKNPQPGPDNLSTRKLQPVSNNLPVPEQQPVLNNLSEASLRLSNLAISEMQSNVDNLPVPNPDSVSGNPPALTAKPGTNISEPNSQYSSGNPSVSAFRHTSDDSLAMNHQSSFDAVISSAPARKAESTPKLLFYLNGAPLRLPPKEDGSPYYLMDMIQYSGIDLKNPRGVVKLSVNGSPSMFRQELKAGDQIRIEEEVT